MVAGVLLLIAWITIVPASASKRAALGARLGKDRPSGLTAMRVARAMVHFASDRAARMLSRASNGEISPEFAAMILRDVAAAPVSRTEAFEEIVEAPEATARRVGDAKFIQIERE